LRELFAKVLKNNGDVEDGVFDWNLLNGGRGWEASVNQGLQGQSAAVMPERRRDPRDDRRRSQGGAGGNVVPPSPALVRHGSKQRRIPAALTPSSANFPGQATPRTDVAQVNVPVTGQRISSHHPYANQSPAEDDRYGQTQYGRTSAMVPASAVPPAISNIKAAGISQGADYHGHDDLDIPPKPSLWRILTCRC